MVSASIALCMVKLGGGGGGLESRGYQWQEVGEGGTHTLTLSKSCCLLLHSITHALYVVSASIALCMAGQQGRGMVLKGVEGHGRVIHTLTLSRSCCLLLHSITHAL